MKIKNDYTNGLEVNDDVAMVLEEQKKALTDYVEELSNKVISNAALDLTKLGDLYPNEFDGITDYHMVDTFAPLIEENIKKKNTFKSKLYLVAKDNLESIRNNAGIIESYCGDIELTDDLEVAIQNIHDELDEIDDRLAIINQIKAILTDDKLDESNMITVCFLKDDAVNRGSIIAYVNCPSESKYKDHYWRWPTQLVLDNSNCDPNKQSINDNKCWIEVPANIMITLMKKGSNAIEVSAKDLKEYMKRPFVNQNSFVDKKN